MNLHVNELLQDVNSKETFRVLWIDDGNYIAYLINIFDEKAYPFKRLTCELKDELISMDFIKIKQDPFIIARNEDNIDNLKLRDNSWNIIKEIVKKEPAIFEKENRSKFVNEVLNIHNISYPAIHKYLRKYWQRGKTIDALLPDYHKSGGKGKEKSSNNKKRGRPRKDNKNGINIDDKTKKIFKVALEKYYLTSKKNNLTEAYKMMIREFYAKDMYYDDNTLKLIIEDEEKLPTLTQFNYWYKKEYTIQESVIAREGRNKYEKDYRAVLNSSTSEVIGPGSRFQIDATVGDVYLISSYNPDWIIGRPVIYLVVDVFSRLIAGMYVGLEGPSWIGAMMALANTASDKQSFCNNYGINISKNLWPSEHLPDVILGDRGELEGFDVERLITAFNIQVENASPYRADWKGIVEKQFDTIQRKVKPFLPGYIDKDFQERGARDYRLDAKLTLEQFTQIIIKEIIKYNSMHYLKDYQRDEDMIRDDVKPIPLELWKWGLENRSGRLRYFSEDVIKLHLLPQAKATVTYKGINFRNILYSCEKAIRESWFPKAREKGSWKVTISYDPRNMSNIYMVNDELHTFELCNLLKHQERYQNKTLDEVLYLLAFEKQDYKSEQYKQIEKDIELMNEIEGIVKPAVKQVDNQRLNNLSKKERISSIKEHRKAEREDRRNVEAFNLGRNQNNDKSGEIIVFNKLVDDEQKHERPSIKDFLARRKEQNDE